MSSLAAVFQIGSLGDSIVSLPTLMSLREYVPDCSEYLLVSRFDSKMKVLPSDIFEMAWKPSIQINYSSPDNRFLQLFTVSSLLTKLRYYRPRYCLYLMPYDRSAEQVERDKRFFRAGGVKELLGFEAAGPEQSEVTSKVGMEETEAYLKFRRLWGKAAAEKFPRYSSVPVIEPGSASVQRVGRWLAEHRKGTNKRLIAVAPYSNFPSKDISDTVLSQLLPQLAAMADAEIVIVGGTKDYSRAEIFCAAATGAPDPSVLNACGAFSVPETAALLKVCSLVISTDTGPMHLAAAVGAPLLVTFSRISKQLGRWLPFGQRSTILYREVPCAGCNLPHCHVAGHPCMELISVDQILGCARDILNGHPVNKTLLDGTMALTGREHA